MMDHIASFFTVRTRIGLAIVRGYLVKVKNYGALETKTGIYTKLKSVASICPIAVSCKIIVPVR